ncbi:sulfite exporter TauE/SafE family protein [Cognatiyoonia sp. IB215446]|uniref:sulfite exporter TauE/SafE family protein n=1 Tax=Cognatiyoonia sp. IB215446 TaxID=3097355 RepID=UPI002A0E966E|nr:sulfite exporter TauE/SafE family protein [Cognatiyoonia sp. IB215446]MDX8350304.1 sulfite exporter TauE/SafE family protein [Cognatiyoonia sp. IB215446]
MDAIFTTLPPALFAFACGVTLLGGFVKGAVGFAMPLVMISGMGILIDPQIVVACIIIPIVFGNGLQVARAGFGAARDAVRDHWRYITLVCVMILISAQFLKSIPTNAMFIVLGVPVVVLCAIQIAGWRPAISDRWRRPFEWGAGTLSGTLGGLAGTWGPPTVLYLLALNTPRDRQMAVQGVIYGLGSVMLFLGHLQSGVLNAQTWPASAALVVPAMLGMWLGFKLGDHFDQERFRRVTLWVLVIAGVNLIRRGVIG